MLSFIDFMPKPAAAVIILAIIKLNIRPDAALQSDKAPATHVFFAERERWTNKQP